MSGKAERDYVLGTHDDELIRLGLQHRVWRPTMLDCWRRNGITTGMRVLDVGSGPGYATLDLAEIVGPTGSVVAVEQSRRFNEVLQKEASVRGLPQISTQEADLMRDDFVSDEFDVAWCRWVACFVAKPQLLVSKISRALKPGGLAIFHEYSDYGTWQFAPSRPILEDFVREVMESWRAQGGEPNIAKEFPVLLERAGFEVVSVEPRIFTVSPSDFIWQWPARFLEVNVQRLVSLGRVSSDWADNVLTEFRSTEEDPKSWMTTPLVLEIVARRQV